MRQTSKRDEIKQKEKFSRTNFHRKLFVLDRSVNYGYSKSASLSLYDELLTSAGFRKFTQPDDSQLFESISIKRLTIRADIPNSN